MSWFWRGFQSAIFYYVSCAPCAKLAYRRQRRKGAQRAKAEKAATEMEQGIYRHPSPFSTNIYWTEEMVLGPGPPQKKGNRDRDKPKAESSRGLRSGGIGSSSITGTSSDTIVEDETRDREAEPEHQSGDGWNRRRYQREDEILWGVDGDGMSGIISRSGTTGSGSYYVARNPAVNDLHPPVVSTQPTHRSETKWMLQPPPSARIMEGKEKATRSRSGSGVSNKSDSSRRRDDVSLGRRVGERLMEEKVKRGEHPESASTSTSMLRLPSRESTRSESHLQGQRHDREPTTLSTALPAANPPTTAAAHNPPPRPRLPTITSTTGSLLAVPRPALLPKHSSSSLPSPTTDLGPRLMTAFEPQTRFGSSSGDSSSVVRVPPLVGDGERSGGMWWPLEWGRGMGERDRWGEGRRWSVDF